MASLPLTFADDAQWLKALQREKFPERIYDNHVPEQIIKVVKKSIKADRGSRYQNCLQFRQALQKISLAVEWFPIDAENWKGYYKNELFEINLYLKRTGYFIDFKRNGRKVNTRCCANISTEALAKQEFFKIIRETTMRI